MGKLHGGRLLGEDVGTLHGGRLKGKGKTWEHYMGVDC